MRRLKNIACVFGILLFILSAASVYAAMQGLSKIRPAESYEDEGVRAFAPYDVLPVQVKNTGTSRDRRMNPARTVYMVYYLATDGSGYQWSDEVPSRDYGKEVVKAGETVKRRVLSIPEDRTYITAEPGQTAESYTAGLRDRYTGIIVLGTLYILFYILVLLISHVLRRLRKNRAEDAELDRAVAPAHAAFSGPEIVEEKRRFRPGKILLMVLPVVLIPTLFWAIGHHSKKTVDLDFGWNENVWTCRELNLRFTLPPGGEIYDAERHDEERREKFGSRGSAGRTLLTVTDSSEGSSLGLLAIADQPSEAFVLKMVTAYAESAAGEGSYDLEAREALTVGGYSWQAWRIELPEQGRVCYYLYRQSGEYNLALTVSGPMSEMPPAILTCFDGENTVPVIPANAYLPPVNGEGYCAFDVPPSLLGNKTPEELVEEWQADLENAENMDRQAWVDLRANESGGVSYVCTPEQYRQMKRFYYYQGTRILPPMFGMDPGKIIKRISYDEMDENGIPWAVNVWIDQSAFQSGGLFSDFIASFLPMTMIGRYQIMCGVPADKWSVHVRLLDVETDAVLFEEDFPAEAG